MRSITTEQALVYAGTTPHYGVRVWVKDARGDDVDLTDFLGVGWVLSVDWGEDIDQPGIDATITLGRAQYQMSLAPGRVNSPANMVGTLLAPYREIWVEVAIAPTSRAIQGTDWVEAFRGNIQSVDWGATDAITINAIGLQGLLQSAFVEAVTVYGTSGGRPVQDVIQDVLSDWSPAPAPTLATPVDPLWDIVQFQSQLQSVWDQIVMLSDSLGWNLRYLYNDGTLSWELTLYEPDRAMTGSVYALSTSRILSIKKAEDALDNVRNVIDLTFGDTTNIQAGGQPSPTTITSSDTASVATYGRRWMGVTLDAASLVTNSAEATRMADAIIADLAYPKTAFEVEIPLFHAVQLGDMVSLPADRIYLDVTTVGAIVGYRHNISSSNARTTLQIRANGVYGAASHSFLWQGMAALPGVGPLQQTGSPLFLNNPFSVDAFGQVSVMPYLQGAISPEGLEIEVHAGRVGFTPDLSQYSDTFMARCRNGPVYLPTDTDRVPIGEDFDIVCYYVSNRGYRSTGYRRTSRAQRPGLGWLSPVIRNAGSFPGSTFALSSRGTAWPTDGWNMAVGTWGTDATQDSGSIYTAPLTGVYAMLLRGALAVEIVSETFPVTTTRRYVSQLAVKASSVAALRKVTASLEWCDASGSTVATVTLLSAVLPTVDTWYTYKQTHAPPATAKSARLRMSKAAYSYFVAIDRLLVEEDAERDDAPQRIAIDDDFPGPDGAPSIGSQPWTLYNETPGGMDPAGAANVSKLPATDWAHIGIASLEAADPVSYPLVAYNFTLGSNAVPLAAGLPPVGLEMAWVVAMGTATADVRAWVGLWENETQAVGVNGESSLSFSQRGVGFIAHGGTWYGIVRVVSAGAHINREVSMGVAADTTWRQLAFRISDTGVEFLLDRVQVGSTQTVSDIGGSTSLFPMFGLVATATDTPSMVVDKVTLAALTDRG